MHAQWQVGEAGTRIQPGSDFVQFAAGEDGSVVHVVIDFVQPKREERVDVRFATEKLVEEAEAGFAVDGVLVGGALRNQFQQGVKAGAITREV